MLTSIMSSNLDAVAFMRFGQNRHAALTLKSALQQLAATCPLSPEEQEQSEASSTSSSSAVDVVTEDLKNTAPQEHIVMDADQQQPGIFTIQIADLPSTFPSSITASSKDGDDSSQEMFSRAFVFSPTYGQGTTSSFNDKISAECAALCLYNLGLCFQLEGLRHGDSAMLAKSIQLYARAYKVVGDCRLAANDPLVVLLMAVAVNLAALHAELYDLQGADMWRNTFRAIYTWATRSSCSAAAAASSSSSIYVAGVPSSRFLPWEPEDFSFFSFCAVVFENQKLSSAAAA
jgi:hypothetical protein